MYSAISCASPYFALLVKYFLSLAACSNVCTASCKYFASGNCFITRLYCATTLAALVVPYASVSTVLSCSSCSLAEALLETMLFICAQTRLLCSSNKAPLLYRSLSAASSLGFKPSAALSIAWSNIRATSS